MGIYLVSVGAREWFDADEEEGRGAVSTGLNEQLRRRGLPPYESVPEAAELVRGSGTRFEEKLVPSMHGFVQLAQAQLAPSEPQTLLDWTVLVPVSLDEEIELPIESAYSDTTVIAGAPQVLGLTRRLAEAVRLPLDEIPEACDNLDLTLWFLEGDAERVAAARPGPWAADLDTAFYVAVYLRAAQHSLRRGCPIVYT
ncbi:hypothetical protein [Streptomyces sp. NPDC057253]|uniref:hypothetical protein n=1 Tax=Streptomyces sp. NPDC057253 TaxID=3346069 RepID=UPI003645F410